MRPQLASALERVKAVVGPEAGIDERLARLRAPMAVALVGRVSSGKSTLVNALLGAYRAPTGVQELTFTITVLRQGDPGLTVHFRDGHTETRDLAELGSLATNIGDRQAFLSSIDHLEVRDSSRGNRGRRGRRMRRPRPPRPHNAGKDTTRQPRPPRRPRTAIRNP
ncbi:dynamin family protein [Actinokineospora auranticolor]|uniref:dynamin family protein n=1 Tax=Actinokineospora auranticolor TaxID=155976 RepID=UPI0011B042FB|nr:dynamin family protein [Actinokineospora auranticolor]